ncbi:cytochrome c oxidase assembly protein [Aquibacillus salsiterrae]|uniref:Cytochrome c oxidase assembly protein n=1 Tax=Aquibacillus salsiterrae TaxID=2950439 RepID=A0A9X3WGT0_9BACI|nr:cytochrome c oxidase assembly protein [Aquibacillus salsiterrae]MDC3418146.1 cytochrome c oxidase assembly protein [Aquibacillus salsiterrae]
MRRILGALTTFIAIAIVYPSKSFAHKSDVRGDGSGDLFQHYTWVEIWNPLLLILLVIVFCGYLMFVRKTSEGFRSLKVISFLLGLLVTYFSLAGPLAILANNLILSAHMMQQSVMYIVMPALILLGMPKEFYTILDKAILDRPFIRILKNPLVNLLLFNALWSFYHIPQIYEYFLAHELQLELLHIVINSAAFLMWVHVLAPEDYFNEMSYLKKIGYMFANGMLITPACALIIFAGDVLYPSINDAPLLYSWLTPLYDQQLGGVIMKIVQEVAYAIVIGILFFKWAGFEKGTVNKIDPLPKNVID